MLKYFKRLLNIYYLITSKDLDKALTEAQGKVFSLFFEQATKQQKKKNKKDTTKIPKRIIKRYIFRYNKIIGMQIEKGSKTKSFDIVPYNWHFVKRITPSEHSTDSVCSIKIKR